MKHGKVILSLAKRYISRSLCSSEEITIPLHGLVEDGRKAKKTAKELADMGVVSFTDQKDLLVIQKFVLHLAEAIEPEFTEKSNDWSPEWASLSMDEQLIRIWKARAECWGPRNYWTTENAVAIFRGKKLIIPVSLYNKLCKCSTVEYFTDGEIYSGKFERVSEVVTLPLDKKYDNSSDFYVYASTPALKEFTTAFLFNDKVEKMLKPCLGWGLAKFGILEDEKDVVWLYAQPFLNYMVGSELSESSFDKILERVDKSYHVAHKIEKGIGQLGGWDVFMSKYRSALAEMVDNIEFCAKYGI